ncbi:MULTISPECIES: hypothetical protein [Mesorhizobium]|jgi:hypothetical protein|uniref:Uncharacterized protein n=1 Tax=Rhizobium loti TaxID=381 RepID=A0A6M7UBM1_RHILI|nr:MULTISPECIES: hypothetical protein [Mesorhizobium]KRB32552.1 hypothetical protein ASE05_06120 [Mesorhizobium sp. Root172]OBQ71409.1 hypothetical protein A8145_00520 [Mesorhizobium loti]QKC73017.1 hypothetical protein EB815_30515 [Mesorhizobium loti]QKC91877.1 hypothetical protein EB230_28350 [Mesorhizobium sp. NZP2234]
MTPLGPNETLDRHALVMACWLAAALPAAFLFDYGFGQGGAPYLLSGFAIILAGFVAHVIVNAVYGTGFSPRELGLGLIIYGIGLLLFVALSLVGAPLAVNNFMPLSVGFITTGAVVIFYLITRYGARQAFEGFDAIRDFRSGDRDSTRSTGGSE